MKLNEHSNNQEGGSGALAGGEPSSLGVTPIKPKMKAGTSKYYEPTESFKKKVVKNVKKKRQVPVDEEDEESEAEDSEYEYSPNPTDRKDAKHNADAKSEGNTGRDHSSSES